EVRRRVDPAGEEQTVAIIRCPGDRYPSEPLGQLHSTGEIRKEANARCVRKQIVDGHMMNGDSVAVYRPRQGRPQPLAAGAEPVRQLGQLSREDRSSLRL